MKIEKIFPHLSRLNDFGDKISKGSKTGANISIGEGGVLLANDMNSIVVLLEHPEFSEEVAFKSHVFPDAEAPLEIEQADKSVDFSWNKKGIRKTVNVPAVNNLFEKGKAVVKKMWKLDKPFLIPTKAFEVIDDNIHVLKIIRNEAGIIFEQTTTTGDEIFRNEVPLKSSGGLLSHTQSQDVEEVETIVPTTEFKALPLLTDESVISLYIPKSGGAIFGQALMGSLNAKIIVSPMKYKR